MRKPRKIVVAPQKKKSRIPISHLVVKAEATLGSHPKRILSVSQGPLTERGTVASVGARERSEPRTEDSLG